MRSIFASFSLAMAVGACATVAAPTEPLVGRWGGEHVDLLLTSANGTLDFDCAAGRIDGPLLIRADGSFTGVGSHTPGTGGPERIGETRPSYPASYSGTVRGDRMTLRIDVPSQGLVIGPYVLTRDARPMLVRCV